MNSRSIIQAMKFTFVGCLNTAIDWAIYFLILKYFPNESNLFYMAAKSFSYFCGIINSFLLNRYWTFNAGDTRHEGIRFIRFVVVNTFSLSINSLIVYILLNYTVTHFYALLIATTITFFLNFILSKLWVFRKEKVSVNHQGINV